MTIHHWDTQIERWMDIFLDDEPDLMGLELVREFDNLARKFYIDDLSEYTESSEVYVGIRSAVVREEVDFVESSYPSGRPTIMKRTERKAKSVPIHTKRSIEKTIGSVEKDSSEDVILSGKNVKIVLQLPVNNKKENIKVVANDDYSITVSHLDVRGVQCTRTLEIPYDIDFETAKATYKNGILEVTFDRQ